MNPVYWWVGSLLSLSLGALLLLIAGCAVAGPPTFAPERTTLAGDRVDLPARTAGQFLVIEAIINGTGPFRLVVDTGASGLILSANLAKQAKIEENSAHTVNIEGVYGGTSGLLAKVNTLESGGLKLERLNAIVVADADFVNIRESLKVDGAIGLGPFHQAVLEVNFPEGKLTVSRFGTSNYSKVISCNYKLIKGVPVVDLAVGKNLFLAEFDSGSDGGLCVPDLTTFPLLYPKVKVDRFRAGIGGNLVLKECTQVAGDVRLGPLLLRNPPIEVGDGRLGVNILKRMKFAINQKEKRIYFVDSAGIIAWDKEVPKAAESWLGMIYRVDEEELYVLEVIKDSPSDLSGLRSHDKILKINGLPPESTVSGSAADGKAVTLGLFLLTIKREEKELTITMVEGSSSDEDLDAIINNFDRIITLFPEDYQALVRRATAKAAKKDFIGSAADFKASTILLNRIASRGQGSTAGR